MRALSYATNAWNLNSNSGNAGNQNNNNKTNANRVRAVRQSRIEGMELPFTAEEIFTAYYHCRKRKRTSKAALQFELHLERNLIGLLHELNSETYCIGASSCFVVTKPKLREVWAGAFRDRIVHHVLYNRIAPHFHARFITDTYACIPDKGTHAAVARFEKFSRSITQNRQVNAYALKCDIANFFVSIDKEILISRLSPAVGVDTITMRLCEKIIRHNPTKNCVIKGSPLLLKEIPRHKSLFFAQGNGLPIGNLSSQFFANVYLDELDQFIKSQHWGKHYIRYVDDMILLHHTPAVLHQAVAAIDLVLNKYQCRLHPNKTQIAPLDQGIPLLGFIARPWCRYVKRNIISNAADMLRDAPCAESINSYYGIMRQGQSYRSRVKFSSEVQRAGFVPSPCHTKVLS